MAAGRAEAAEQRLWAREAAADVQVRAAPLTAWHVLCAVCSYTASAAVSRVFVSKAQMQLHFQAGLPDYKCAVR